MAEMRCLTIRQPWAWAIATQGKDVENRTWKTSYRGLLAIHAGSTLDGDADEYATLMPESAARALRKVQAEVTLAGRLTDGTEHLRLGRVVAVAEVVGCHLSPDFLGTCGATRPLCSPWAVADQYHWLLDDVRQLPEPVRCKGKQRLWDLPDDVEKAVREQLSEVRR